MNARQPAETEAARRGARARQLLWPQSANPYDRSTAEHADWQRAWERIARLDEAAEIPADT